MAFKRSYRSYTFTLLLLTVAVGGGYWVELPFLTFMEDKAFDLMVSLRTPESRDDVVLVAIDDKSLEEKGGWPWPRSDLAAVIEKISQAGASGIGLYLLYPERALHPGLDTLRDLHTKLDAVAVSDPGGGVTEMRQQVAAAQSLLDPDRRLTEAVRSARNVVLPLRFVDADPGPADPRIEALIRIHSLPSRQVEPAPRERLGQWVDRLPLWPAFPPPPAAVVGPYPDLAGKAGGLGHINMVAGADGQLRSESLLLAYQDRLVPSFSLQLALKYWEADVRLMAVEAQGATGWTLVAGNRRIPTGRAFRFRLGNRPPTDRFTTVSFVDVEAGRLSGAPFRNRVVIVGPTSRLLTSFKNHPSGAPVAPVAFAAGALAGLLDGDAPFRPAWASLLELGATLYLAFFLWVVIPRVQLRVGGLILTVFVATWLGAAVLLFKFNGLWLYLFPPVLLATAGLFAAARHRHVEGLLRRNAELTRTLALAYQAQGQLEMAARELLACPAESRSVREALFQLGGEMERKRLYERALEVYTHLLKFGRHREARQRVRRIRAAGENSAINGATLNGRTVVMVDGPSHPTFGRYEILSELGQGAMGTVFLGRDPKINREVAIKTLDYRSIPSAELEDMKGRFFREAEAAGKLSHPSIVTIYDVGEEHDMAYMAMERLDGKDLSAYCRPEDRLPAKQVIEVMARVAEALEYAHGQGVVHRDIKPANIMLLKSGEVKVADFGIARIMDNSKTRTGIVLGTPFYMSPEQVAGKKVDGRSDLFSMGVVFYELLAGQRPFEGDSMTALMYAISKTPHTPLVQVAPDLPECCLSIVERLLRKGVTRRFRSASVLAKAMRECLEGLGG